MQEDRCRWCLDCIVSQELGFASRATHSRKLWTASDPSLQNACCCSYTINNTPTKRDRGGVRHGHGHGVQNHIQRNWGDQFSQQTAATTRRPQQLLHELSYSIDTMRWDDHVRRLVQPGSKPISRLLRCEYCLRKPPPKLPIRIDTIPFSIFNTTCFPLIPGRSRQMSL